MEDHKASEMSKTELVSPVSVDITSTPSESDNDSVMWTLKDEERIRKRLDWTLMPAVFVLYLMCFIDRANIGNARIQGLTKDLHLVGHRFNWALTVYFIAYVAVSIPANVALRAVGGHRWIPMLVVVFGIMSLSTAFIQNYSSLLAVRFLLGLAEGGMFGGLAYYLSTFYRRHELAFRVAIYVVGAGLAGAFGGLLAAGLSQIPEWGSSTTRLHDWRNIFFFEGLLTILLGLVAFRYLPAEPSTCHLLATDMDRAIAADRIKQDNRQHVVDRIQARHVIRALFNINTTICGIGMMCINVSVNSISLFLPTILNSFRWSPVKSQLWSVPPYAIAALYAISTCWLSDALRRRGIFAILNSLISLVGFALLLAPNFSSSSSSSSSLATTHPNTTKYIGVFFAAAGCFPSGPAFMVWAMNNAGDPTSRAITAAHVVFLGNMSSFLAVWSYLPEDGPAYTKGHAVNLGAHVLAVLVAGGGIAYVRWENYLRRSGKRDARLVGLDEDERRALGYRHPDFRYTD